MNTSLRRWVPLCAALLLFVPACDRAADLPPALTASRLAAAEKEPGNWLTVGRTYSGQRYSPLDQIKADNVAQLGLAWYHDFDTEDGQEATPLVVDAILYTSTAWSIVKAYDAKTGQPLWTFDPLIGRERLSVLCCGAVNRGVAAANGRIYVGALDGRLIALNARTGTPVWDVQTADPSKPYSITGAPLVVGSRVLIGNAGGKFGVRGYLSAYDAENGALAWRFFTVPGDKSQPFESDVMAMAAKSWKGKGQPDGAGGGAVWGELTYDPDLDLVYFGTGAGAPTNQSLRSPDGGDNLFLSSIVAVKGATGDYVWHYQTTPGDDWGFDAAEDPVLAELPAADHPRPVLLQAAKNGFFYVLDRATGKLLSAKPFTPTGWASGVDPATGRPRETPGARYDKTGKTTPLTPGMLGAHSWQPMSFDPATGLAYIPAQEIGFSYKADPKYKAAALGFDTGLDLGAVAMPADNKTREAALAAAKGYLLAWDPVKQAPAWRVDYRGPWNGGTLSTAGNLVFEGDAGGGFQAYRADNGGKLWSIDTGSAVMAAPMTYAVDGEQYVAVLSGWGGAFALWPGIVSGKSGNLRNMSRLLVFKLGGTANLPPAKPLPVVVLDPPRATADAATIAGGRDLYARYCGSCHGGAAIGGGIVPDIRYSSSLKDDSWFDVVLNGARKDGGMVGYAAVLDKTQATAIRAYVVKRANEDKPPAPIAKPAETRH